MTGEGPAPEMAMDPGMDPGMAPVADPAMDVPTEDDFAGADPAAGAIDEPTGRIPKESLEKVGRYIYEHKMANGKVPVEAIKKAAAYLKMQQAK